MTNLGVQFLHQGDSPYIFNGDFQTWKISNPNNPEPAKNQRVIEDSVVEKAGNHKSDSKFCLELAWGVGEEAGNRNSEFELACGVVETEFQVSQIVKVAAQPAEKDGESKNLMNTQSQFVLLSCTAPCSSFPEKAFNLSTSQH